MNNFKNIFSLALVLIVMIIIIIILFIVLIVSGIIITLAIAIITNVLHLGMIEIRNTNSHFIDKNYYDSYHSYHCRLYHSYN